MTYVLQSWVTSQNYLTSVAAMHDESENTTFTDYTDLLKYTAVTASTVSELYGVCKCFGYRRRFDHNVNEECNELETDATDNHLGYVCKKAPL